MNQRDPLDTRAAPLDEPAVYNQPPHKPQFPVAALTLPIGTTNTPEAVREIIEPPWPLEDATSPLGRLRYYNQCDLLVIASDTGLTASSGSFNNFLPLFPTNEVLVFASITNSFYDAREGKTVLPIDLNIGSLAAWSATNTSLRNLLIGSNVTSVYVLDNRTPSATTLGAVRVFNGTQLPLNGLTVATGRPLYV